MFAAAVADALLVQGYNTAIFIDSDAFFNDPTFPISDLMVIYQVHINSL